MDLGFLIKKLLNRSINIIKEFRDLRSQYSFYFAFITLMWWLMYYLHWKKGNNYFARQKQKAIDKIIDSEFSDIVAKYKDKPESAKIVKDFRIWVFWAQGEEKMPKLVKSCFNQLKHIEEDKVVLITLGNIKNYVDLPNRLYDLLGSGKILYAHFSDILRNYLIAKYGGVWYDATCWITATFPNNLKKYSYFSPKNHRDGTRGVVYAMGSGVLDSVTFSFVRDILILMIQSGKNWPDYLFQDYVFNYARKNISATKEAIEILPDNNTQRFLLFSWMNQPFDKTKYEKLIENNWIFKLSYKTHYKDYTDGKPTFYHHLINPEKQKV